MEFIIPGATRPKARPRTTFQSGKPVTYTPPESRDYAEKVRLLALNEWNKQNIAPIPYPRPVKMEITFILDRKPTARPDIVNLAAQIADILQGDRTHQPIAYDDDSQITELHLYKKSGRFPMTRVVVEEL